MLLNLRHTVSAIRATELRQKMSTKHCVNIQDGFHFHEENTIYLCGQTLKAGLSEIYYWENWTN